VVTQGVPIRLMHDAHLQRRSGRLFFEAGEARCVLHFVDGQVVSAGSSRREHGLPALLLRSGRLELEQLEWALREATRSGRALGQLLTGAGLLDERALEEALVAQARGVVSDLTLWDEGHYRYVPDGGPHVEEDVAQHISTDELIVGAVRGLSDPDVVRFSLGDLDRVLVPAHHRAHQATLNLLQPGEQALLDDVDGRTTARALLASSGRPAQQAQHMLLTLLALGLVEYEAPA
jgi:hypothetical protein